MTGSAELRLAIECCARSFARADGPNPDLPLRGVDWGRFVRLVQFHRIAGLAWNALAAADGLPPVTRETLRSDAAAIAARNLQALAECRQLLASFEAAKLPLLFLKGLTLGALAYGNPAIKSGVDIDVLIDPGKLSQAARVLRDCGYRPVFPPKGSIERWHRRNKESDWSKGPRSLQLDLHTRTTDNPRMIPTISVDGRRQTVDVEGTPLPTLAGDELFAYLAVHGASSAWFRIKWISDFAALLHGQPPEGLERLYRRSEELRAGRAVGQALLLADALFGSLRCCPHLSNELTSDPMTRLLFRAALKQVTGAPREPTERRFGTMTIHWTQFLLLPGLAYKWSELTGQAGRILSRF